jgi:hypothetical protein
MDAKFFSERSVDHQRIMPCYIPEDRTVRSHRCENVNLNIRIVNVFQLQYYLPHNLCNLTNLKTPIILRFVRLLKIKFSFEVLNKLMNSLIILKQCLVKRSTYCESPYISFPSTISVVSSSVKLYFSLVSKRQSS